MSDNPYKENNPLPKMDIYSTEEEIVPQDPMKIIAKQCIEEFINWLLSRGEVIPQVFIKEFFKEKGLE